MGANDTFRGDRDKRETAAPVRLVGEIGLVDYPSCQESAIYGLGDVFRVASDYATDTDDHPAAIRVSTWTVTGSGPNAGMVCTFDSHPETEHRLSHIIVPPSLVVPEDMTSVDTLGDWIRDLKSGGTILCAVCAGVFVLAETGMLDGRDATTHWAFADHLATQFPKIRVDAARMVIDDIDIITAAGILAWVDLGLTLVDRLLGPSVMLHTARFILADPPRRQQRTYQEFTPRLRHGDKDVLTAQTFIHANSGRQLAVAELAQVAGVQPRTFQRRFKEATGSTLTEYLQSVRIAKARESLELSRTSVEQIAMDVGYLDVSTLRRLFQRTTGLTPSEYRKRFGIADRGQGQGRR